MKTIVSALLDARSTRQAVHQHRPQTRRRQALDPNAEVALQPERGSPDPQRVEPVGTDRKFPTLSSSQRAAALESRAPGALSTSDFGLRRWEALLLAGLFTVVPPLHGAAGPAGWVNRSSGTTETLNAIAYGGGVFVVAGNRGTLLISPDGGAWTAVDSGTNAQLQGVTWAAGMFVVVGGVTLTDPDVFPPITEEKPVILTSPNGRDWTPRNPGAGATLNGVGYGNGRFVAVGRNGTILTSTDGVAWSNYSINPTLTLNGLVYADHQFVIVSDFNVSSSVFTSIDGESWVPQTTPTGAKAVTHQKDQFVAVGANGVAMTSPDGISWTLRYLPLSATLFGVTSGDCSVLTVSDLSTVGISPDGISWKVWRGSPVDVQLRAVTFINGNYLAVGANGTILYSGPMLPLITQQPVNLTVPEGFSGPLLYARTLSDCPPSLQWWKDGAPVPGATDEVLNFTNFVSSAAGTYSLVASNVYGVVTSAPAVLKFLSVPLAITSQPGHQNTFLGGTATFSVGVLGGSLTFQWYKGQGEIPGATNVQLTLTNVQFSDAGTYSVAISNGRTNLLSSDATLTVREPAIFITRQPAGGSIIIGSSWTFSVSAYGEAGNHLLTYQWRKGGAAIPGATNAQFTLSNVQFSDAGAYSVALTNRHLNALSSDATLTVREPAVIISRQPAGGTVPIEFSWTFSVSAYSEVGSYPLTYQWRKGGVAIPGATNSQFTLANVQLTNSGTYSVAISNGRTNALSFGATLTVREPAFSITRQPEGGTAPLESSWTFSVSAYSEAAVYPLTYQWRKGTAAISGATNVQLTLTNIQFSDAGTYSVTISNGRTNLLSSGAILTVREPAIFITRQPDGGSAPLGASWTFFVSAYGEAGNHLLTYQWRKGGAAIPGATNTQFTLNNVQFSDAGAYSVALTNQQLNALSLDAALTVREPAVVITGQPGGGSVIIGSSWTFSVSAYSESSTYPLTYQWRKGGVAIPGATNNQFTLNNVQITNSGTYSVAISNGRSDAFSFGATLTVHEPPPVITAQPRSQNIALGETASFTVTATGVPPVAYQWRKYGTPIPGATNAQLVVVNAQAGDAGDYSVLVSNPGGSVVSAVATLTVRLPPILITRQPEGGIVSAGASWSLFVDAYSPSGIYPLTFQWFKDGAPTGLPQNYANNLSFSPLALSNSGTYTVRISNSQGTLISQPVVLTVPPPDRLDYWQSRASGLFHGVAADSARLVAVGSAGLIADSPDGVNWSYRNSGTGQDLLDIAFGVGVFVVVGTNGVVLTSPDGAVWTRRDSGVTNALMGIAFNQGLFVAVGHGGVVLTSPDGIAWTTRRTGEAETLYDIVFGNGRFLIVGSLPTLTNLAPVALTSPDGTAWTVQVLAAPALFSGVTFGNGLFAAVAPPPWFWPSYPPPYYPGARIYTSTDGLQWELRNAQSSYYQTAGRGLAYGGGYFVAGGGPIRTSTDGVAWRFRLGSGGENSAIFFNNSFVGVGPGGIVQSEPLSDTAPLILRQPRNVMVAEGDAAGFDVGAQGTSPLFYQWRKDGAALPNGANSGFAILPALPADAGSYTVTVNNAFGVAVSQAASLTVTQRAPALALTWQQRLPLTPQLQSLAFGNGIFVGLGNGGLLHSPDGINWLATPTAALSNTYSTTLFFADGQFVVLGLRWEPALTNSVRVRLNSTNGLDWTAQAGDQIVDISFSSVVLGDRVFVGLASGYDSTNQVGWQAIYSSPDTLAWTQRYFLYTTNASFSGITYGNGQFVAMGYRYTPQTGSRVEVLISPDGIAWTRREPNWTPQDPGCCFSSIVFGNGAFTAMGPGFATSTNGVDWISQPNPVNGSVGLNSLWHADGLFLALGTDYSGPSPVPVLLVSRDGLNWALNQTDFTGNPTTLTHGNGLFVLAADGGAIWTSPNGARWIRRSPADSLGPSWLTSIEYDRGLLVAVGNEFDWVNGTAAFVVLTSSNGFAWTKRVAYKYLADPFGLPVRVAAGNGRWVAAAGLADFPGGTPVIKVAVSTNGTDWRLRGTGIPGYGYDLALLFGNGRFFLYSDGSYATSTNGVNWSPVINDYTVERPSTFTFGNGVFLGTGFGNRVYVSTNGLAWTRLTEGPSGGLATVEFGNGRFVGHGALDTLHVSLDGIHWTQVDGPLPPVGRDIGGGVWLSGNLLSTDGSNWSRVNLPGFDDIASINQTLVALTGNNPSYILQSDPLTNSAPVITLPPVDRAVPAGLNASFLVSALGSQPLRYQWRRNGVPIPGATNALLIVRDAQLDDTGHYSVVASNPFGSATSAAASLVVEPLSAPIITQQPQSQNVFEGTNVNLSVIATGTEPLFYQWQKDGTNLSGAVGPSFRIPYAWREHAGVYAVTITNAFGSAASQPATLTVGPPPPVITLDPQNVTVREGAWADFCVNLNNWTSETTFQWLKNGVALAEATNSCFSLTNTDLTDAGQYSVIVSNGPNYVVSRAATLTVVPLGPLDSGHQINVSGYASNLLGVAYGNGRFVAVGDRILFSTDAESWAPVFNVGPNLLHGVTWGARQFVAVGEAGTILTSPDTDVWTTRRSEMNEWLNAVVYAAGLYVAVGQNTSNGTALVLVSSDGIQWSNRAPMDVYAVFQSVAYGNGRFVAVGNNNGQVLLSADGLNWSLVMNPSSGVYANSISFGAGRFVAVNGNQVFISTDGETWSSSYIQNGYANGVTYGNGRFVGVSGEGGIHSSIDGVFWLTHTNTPGLYLNAVAYGMNRFVAVGWQGIIFVTDVFTPEPPRLLLQPESRIVLSGSTVGFGIGVSGQEPFAYQWWKNGAVLPGATNAGLILRDVQESDAGNYFVVVQSALGTATSQAATLAIEPRVPPLAWHRRNPFPTAMNLDTVAFGNGRFVALAYDGTSVVLSNGLDWVAARIGTNVWSYRLVFGNGQFIVPTEGYYDPSLGYWVRGMATSVDGLTWTVNTLNTNVEFNALAYANGQFVGLTYRYDNVAQRYRNFFLTSSNATDWLVRDMDLELQFALYEITFGAGVYVAQGYGFDQGQYRMVLVTSLDGSQWTRTEVMTEGYQAGPLAFGGSGFVGTVGNGKILTSPDGLQWSLNSGQSAPGWLRLRFLNGLYVAMTGNSVVSSTNGVFWSYQDTGSRRSLFDITSGNGLFVAVGEFGAIHISSDLAAWTQRSGGATEFLRGVASADGTFVVVGGGDDFWGNSFNSPYTNVVLTSADGADWERQPSEPNSALFGVAHGSGQFVAVGRGYDPFTGRQVPFIQNSPDGLEWTRAEIETLNDGQLYGVAFGAGQFVAVGWGYNQFLGRWEGLVFTSPDGITWTHENSGAQNELRGITWANGLFVAGTYGAVLTSPDGVNWAPQSLPPPMFRGAPLVESITYGRGRYVAVGGGGCFRGGCDPSGIWTSLDGTNWLYSFNTPSPLYDVTYARGAFFAVGQGGQIWSSTLGVNWSRQDSGTFDWLAGIGAGPNGTLLAVGERGAILQSDPFTGFNRAPTALASVVPVADFFSTADESVVLSTNNHDAAVAFDGSLSSDPDGDALDFLWLTQVNSGPVVPLTTTVRTAATFDVGEHVVSLIVDDGFASDTNILHLRVLTAGDALDELIDLVQDSNLDWRQRLLLQAALYWAQASFERGKFEDGLRQLRFFRSLVRTVVRPRDPTLAGRLLAGAGAIRDAFNAGTLPPPGVMRLTFVSRHADGTVELQLTGGDAGTPCVIEVSTDLITWTAWQTVTTTYADDDEPTTILDPGAATSACRFYRAVAP